MTLILIVGLMLLGGAAFICARSVFTANDQRRDGVELARNYMEQHAERRRTSILGPAVLRFRALLVTLALKLSWRTSVNDIETRIAAAGLRGRLSVEGFLALRLACIALGVLAAFSLAGVGLGGFLLAIIFGYAGVFLPRFALSRRASQRAESASDELPHLIDRLAIAMEAGLSFDGALVHVVDQMEGPLAQELRVMLAEVRVGASRSRALRDMTERVQSPDVSNFTTAILQAEQLGMSVSGILRNQASEVRNRRQMAAEERAMKAPVKVLFPIVIFILPVMFVVILGPPIIDAMNSL